MVHQLYQYNDAIIRWSWRQVRGGRGGAGIAADGDTGTTLAVSNIGLVKWWLRLMSFESSSLIREREPLRYWLSVARRWEFHRIWECNLSSWLRCFVVKAPAVLVSLSLSRSAIESSLSITGYNDIGQTAKSSSSKERVKVVDDVDDESEIWLKYRVSLPRSIRFVWVSLNGDDWLIDWLIKCQLSIDQTNRYRLIDWVSESLSCERLFDSMMRFVLTLTHTHWHWGTYSHTVMQVPKWQCSNQVSESVNERAIGRVCVASRTKLAHTHTSIWLLLLSHWMVSVSRVCVDVSLSLWVREQADTRWMIGNTTKRRERDRVMVIESWVATLHSLSLSRALRARGRRATLPSWDRCRCVPQYKW